jgi:hypothetical protein
VKFDIFEYTQEQTIRASPPGRLILVSESVRFDPFGSGRGQEIPRG